MRASFTASLLLKTVVATVLVLAAAEVIAASPEPDLMNTPACKEARDKFDAAFAAARDVKSGSGNEALNEARRAAAMACFGRVGGMPQRVQGAKGALGSSTGLRAPYPAVAVPSTAATLKPAPSAATPQPPVQIQRPSTLTTCDPGGCWSNDGTRLNRVGPELAGPRGACMVQGNVASCP